MYFIFLTKSKCIFTNLCTAAESFNMVMIMKLALVKARSMTKRAPDVLVNLEIFLAYTIVNKLSSLNLVTFCVCPCVQHLFTNFLQDL